MGDEKQLKVDPWTGAKPRKQQESGAWGCGNASNPWEAMMAMMMGKGGYGGYGGYGGGGGWTPKVYDNERKVNVTNVPQGASWQELKVHMQSAGTVEFCNVKFGSGEVRYKTEAEAQNAVATLDGSLFGVSSLQ